MRDGSIHAAILSDIRDALSSALYWAPDWAFGVVLLAIAAIVALVVHRIISIVLRRAFGERHPLLRSIFGGQPGRCDWRWSPSRSPSCCRRRRSIPW